MKKLAFTIPIGAKILICNSPSPQNFFYCYNCKSASSKLSNTKYVLRNTPSFD